MFCVGVDDEEVDEEDGIWTMAGEELEPRSWGVDCEGVVAAVVDEEGEGVVDEDGEISGFA